MENHRNQIKKIYSVFKDKNFQLYANDEWKITYSRV
jgi:hypothetical protein